MLTQPAYLTEPIFAFTCDVDWAPEAAIAKLLALFDDYRIPLTPFVTHDSPVIRQHFGSAELRVRVGIHPNFLTHSTQGVNQAEVLDTACGFWPEARGSRSHSFYDTASLALALRDRGFEWDSNLPLLFQERLVPLAHFSGIVRFPVFWEDYVHIHKELPFDLRETSRLFETPGLKVINVHPLLFAWNSASPEQFARSKSLWFNEGRLESKDSRSECTGVGTFVTQLLDFVRDRSFRTAYLDDLFLEYDERDADGQLRKTPWQRTPNFQSSGKKGRVKSYKRATDQQKTAMIEAEFGSRDPRNPYASSPDLHMRELGIGFMSEHIGEGRILEVGCANGHALMSLARTRTAEMIGIDLSVEMIEGARTRAREVASELKGSLHFQQGDVRSLPFASESFEYVVSQGCIVTLPSREDQWQTIREIHRVLVDGGVFVMLEGSADGLRMLNRVRRAVGLEPVPDVSDENFSSLKFEEDELDDFLGDLFVTQEVRYFGAYYIVSRLVHPLLALPRPPHYEASINRKAREIDQVVRDCGKLGPTVGYKLVARKALGAKQSTAVHD
jgi:SAM-dependent methyltransferase